MLVLINRPPYFFSIDRLKALVKKTLGLIRGPDVVLQSLDQGLDILSYPHVINGPINNADTVHVLSNIEALRYAIDLKSKGLIKHLIAGPNLLITPDDYNKILLSPEIDLILIVSEWTKDFYSKILPTVAHKIHIWPAGVEIPKIESGVQKNGCLIFKKNVSEDLYKKVSVELDTRGIPHTTISYGNFNQKKYFKQLESAKFMIYLQEAESQGLALQEAWVRDVPTLVWNKGSFVHTSGDTITGNIAAPFLTDECGLFFKDEFEFPKKLKDFLDRLDKFTSRKYCMENLSDQKSAEIYVKIIQSIQ